jgi:mRNA interferase MazF
LARIGAGVARILRGDVLWADLDPTRGHEQGGSRPILVISEDVFNQRSGTVIALAVTSVEPSAGFPLTLELRSVRLPKRSWVKIGQVRTLSTERLGKRLARLSPEELARVVEGLGEIIGG